MIGRFNLIDAPWIPCTRQDGARVLVGLREVLEQAQRYRSVESGNPLVDASIVRLLLAILHRVLGPPDRAAWAQHWQAGRWPAEELRSYLNRWADRFYLFDDVHPFFQADDPRVKPKSVVTLVFSMASGNNATLFDHHTEEGGASLTPAEAAQALVAAQTFSLAGLSGLPQKFTDAACARGVVFFLEGHNLFETLALNLLRYDANHPAPPLCQAEDDRPAWEADDAYMPERQVPLGYLDYLTWPIRRIRLIPEEGPDGVCVRQFTVGPGLRLSPDLLDPMKLFSVDEKRGYRVLRFVEDRVLWRDSSALFQVRSQQRRPPVVMEWVSTLVLDGILPQSARYTIQALGMANDQAKVEFLRSERFSMPMPYLVDESLVADLDLGLQQAEAAHRALSGAAWVMAKTLMAPSNNLQGARQPDKDDVNRLVDHWGSKRIFWSRLEVPFRLFLDQLPDDHGRAVNLWRAAVRSIAYEAFGYAESQASIDPAGYKATSQGRSFLNREMGKLFKYEVKI